MTDTTFELVKQLVEWLKKNRGKLPRDKLEDTVLWIQKHGSVVVPEDAPLLRKLVCDAFKVSEEEVLKILHGPSTVKVIRRDDFIPLVPKEGWFRWYYEYTENTEAPSVFHFMAALTVVGASLKRNVYVSQGLWNVYPNIATFLIGPSTWTHKTTAINIAVAIGLKASAFRPIAERATSEYIIEALAEGDQAVGFVILPELAASITRKKYQEDMIHVLTRLWDCPDQYIHGTIGRGGKVLNDVAVATLAGSTVEWLIEAIPGTAFSGGFMARVLQVYQESGYKIISRPQRPPDELKDRLIEALGNSRFQKGEILRSPACAKHFDEWYGAFREKRPDDSRLDPFYGRSPDHLLRIAMILRLAENGFEDRPDEKKVYIGPSHLDEADAILRWIIKYLPKVYAPLGVAQVGVDAERILRFLRQKGGRATMPQLMRHMRGFVTTRQLEERLQYLMADGEIEPVTEGVWTGYRLSR